jgi:hypothetical protein
MKIEEKMNKKFWEELIAYFPLYDTGHIENVWICSQKV